MREKRKRIFSGIYKHQMILHQLSTYMKVLNHNETVILLTVKIVDVILATMLRRCAQRKDRGLLGTRDAGGEGTNTQLYYSRPAPRVLQHFEQQQQHTFVENRSMEIVSVLLSLNFVLIFILHYFADISSSPEPLIVFKLTLPFV